MLVVEGLIDLISKAIEREDFEGFTIEEGLIVEIIQFADDILFTGGGEWKNLWSIKAILREFELVSGLKDNFLKSRLIGINLSKHFPDVASNFLTRKIEESNFKFLRILIGSNPRKVKTWLPILEKLKNKTALWK